MLQRTAGLSRRALALLVTALMLAGMLVVRAGAANAAVASPRISVGADVVVGESVGSVTVPVTLSEAGLSTVTVNYSTANSTAFAPNSGTDYTGISGTLTFTPGQTTKNIVVQVTNDLDIESPGFESFYVSLSAATNATIARATAMVSIVDNDTVVAAPKLFIRDAIVDEKAGTVNVPVILGGPASQSSNTAVTVHYATTNGTATAGTDYVAKSGTLTFAAHETVKTIPVAITDDAAAEPSERFTITLSAPTGGATIADNSGTVIIGASDGTPVAQPRISASPDLVIDEAVGYLDVPVTLSAPGQSVVTVNVTTADSTAFAPNSGNDYIGRHDTLTFAPGETTKTFRVEILDDTSPEVPGFESFYVSLSAATNATIARATAMVSIVDNDNTVAAPKLFIRDAIVDEKAGTVNVPVILGGPASQSSNTPVTVHYATVNGTATAATDYAATSGTLTFPAHETVKNIPVAITDDAAAEPSERFTITLSAPTGGATIADNSGTVIIGASDGTPVAQPRISASPDLVIDEAVGYLDVPVTLSAPGQSVVTVNVTTADSTAVAPNSGTDYRGRHDTLTFAPGETTKTFRVEILDDTSPEVPGFESFYVSLTANPSVPLNATIARATTMVSIVDNDNTVAAPKLFIRDAIVDEKAGTVNVPVILGGPASQSSNTPVTVHYATTNGTASAATDYTATSGTLTFPAHETVKNIPVAITDDAAAEPSERFTITLSAPTGGATIADNSGTVIIGASDAGAVAQPGISVADRVVAENTGFVDVPVTLSAPGQSVVTVNITTADGTAVAPNSGNDYRGRHDTLTFAPGETTKTFRVEILDDTTPEVPAFESFSVLLSTPANATLTKASANAVIIDNDNGANVYGLGIGNDVYSIVASSDQIAESPDGGTDTAFSPVTYALPTNVENLVLTGAGAINGTGNGSDNVLSGNGAANTLTAFGGNDTLNGGAGSDTLAGGTGSDVFNFASLVGFDTVNDFASGTDHLGFSQAGITIGNGNAVVDAAQTVAGPGGFAKTAELVIVTGNIAGSITTTNAAAKIGSATAAYATGDTRLFVVDNGTETRVFRFVSSSANAAVSAAELTLVAVVKAPSTTVSDYRFSA